MQAKRIRDQIREIGTWVDAGGLRAEPSLIEPGMIVVWDRSDPARPETSWWGHVGVVSRALGNGEFETIEGNSGPAGDRVARVRRRSDDPRLLGAGSLPAEAGAPAAGLRRLAAEVPEGADDAAPAP